MDDIKKQSDSFVFPSATLNALDTRRNSTSTCRADKQRRRLHIRTAVVERTAATVSADVAGSANIPVQCQLKCGDDQCEMGAVRELRNAQYAYVAYVYTAADQLKYNTFSFCGLQQMPTAQMFQMTSVPSGLALTLPVRTDPFFVTVVASTNAETAGGGSFGSTLYPEITVNVNSGGGGGGGSGGGGGGSDTAALLAGILVPLILILLCAVAVLAYRNRQMARTMSFELGGSLSSLPGLLLEKARRGPPSVRTSRIVARQLREYSHANA